MRSRGREQEAGCGCGGGGGRSETWVSCGALHLPGRTVHRRWGRSVRAHAASLGSNYGGLERPYSLGSFEREVQFLGFLC